MRSFRRSAAVLSACLLAVAFAEPLRVSAAPVQAGDVSRQLLVMMRLPPDHVRPNAEYGGGYRTGGESARRRAAERLARAYGLTLVGNWPMPLIGVDCFVLQAPDGPALGELADRLSQDPSVEWAQPVSVYQGQGDPAAPNDPLFLAEPAAHEWRLSALHQIATGRNVRVAVVDSLVDVRQPDLAGQVEISMDFAPVRAAAPEQHGTGVAGVIAARAGNGVGIAGVAPGARLMALRACWETEASKTLCDSLSLAKALDFAINHKAQVINLSLSGPPDPLLGKLLDVARARHITVVGAYDRGLPDGGFPASHPGVVAVADESPAGAPAGVYAAPGDDVPTTLPGSRWSLVNGSSFAAAHVSGLFALMRERASGSASLSLAAEHGVVDACASLRRSMSACACGCAETAEGGPVNRR